MTLLKMSEIAYMKQSCFKNVPVIVTMSPSTQIAGQRCRTCVLLSHRAVVRGKCSGICVIGKYGSTMLNLTNCVGGGANCRGFTIWQSPQCGLIACHGFAGRKVRVPEIPRGFDGAWFRWPFQIAQMHRMTCACFSAHAKTASCPGTNIKIKVSLYGYHWENFRERCVIVFFLVHR